MIAFTNPLTERGFRPAIQVHNDLRTGEDSGHAIKFGIMHLHNTYGTEHETLTVQGAQRNRGALTKAAIERAAPKAKPYELRDPILAGFLLRVQPSGVKTFYLEWGRGRRVQLGRAGVLTSEQARQRAAKLLRETDESGSPQSIAERNKPGTLKEFLDRDYEPWALENMGAGKECLASIRASFPDFLDRRLSEITSYEVERWRTARLKSGLKPATVNRCVGQTQRNLPEQSGT